MLDRLVYSQRPVVVSEREFIALSSRCRPSSASALEQKTVNSSYKESRNDDAHLWLMLPKVSPSPIYTKYRVFTITM